ncbi:MAG: hypothetical protein CMK07_14145 [Ponticaulis sp.]|nr:hypothetical protein [Ponticaulis sp.]
MMTKLWVALAGVLVLAACESTAGAGAEVDVSVAPLSGGACPYNENGAHLFWIEPPSREVGGTVGLTPYFSTHPGHFEDLPSGCIGDMSAMPEEAVSFSRQEDGMVYATLTQAAEPGSKIILTTSYGGVETISATINVYDGAANPLVGYWAQENDGSCSEDSIIRELIFQGDGTFSVTWTPFESYKDYWGEYEYETETGLLILTPDGGNNVPEDVSSGTIRLEDGQFTLLDGTSFGSTRAGESCAAPFVGGGG